LSSMTNLCQPFDSVSLCMNKGLGASIGSVLVGSQPFIKQARWFKKMFGGGVRQVRGSFRTLDFSMADHSLSVALSLQVPTGHSPTTFRNLRTRTDSPVS
jgi:threonine aldolase